MRERHVALILCDAREHFQKDFLSEILFGDTSRQTRPHDANDHGVKMFDQIPRRPLVRRTHPLETTGKVKGLVVGGHGEIKNTAYTIGKTRLRSPGYTRKALTTRSLTSPRGGG